jgi:hypothetical protein
MYIYKYLKYKKKYLILKGGMAKKSNTNFYINNKQLHNNINEYNYECNEKGTYDDLKNNYDIYKCDKTKCTKPKISFNPQNDSNMIYKCNKTAERNNFRLININGEIIKRCNKKREFVNLDKVKMQNGKMLYDNQELLKDRHKIKSGTFGAVYRMHNKDDSIELALKMGKTEYIKQEEVVFKLIGNDNTCKVIQGINKQNGIVMQLMDGDISKLAGVLHPSVVLQVCKSIAETLHCLFLRQLIYTDIKPDNTLFYCTGNGTFDIILGDVGDIFFLNKNQHKNNYVETYAYPYENERNESNNDKTDYFDLIKPMTLKNAENHLVWGVACLFFLMLDRDNNLRKELGWTRKHTNKDFLEKRIEIAKRLQEDPYKQYEEIKEMEVFAQAIVDPTIVRLKDIFSPDWINKKNYRISKEF